MDGVVPRAPERWHISARGRCSYWPARSWLENRHEHPDLYENEADLDEQEHKRQYTKGAGEPGPVPGAPAPTPVASHTKANQPCPVAGGSLHHNTFNIGLDCAGLGSAVDAVQSVMAKFEVEFVSEKDDLTREVLVRDLKQL